MRSKIPQNLKYPKFHKRFIYAPGKHHHHRYLLRGVSCALVCVESGLLTPEQIATAQLLIHKSLKSTAKLKGSTPRRYRCLIAVRAPITRKALGSRMGRGKGSAGALWAVTVPRGRILFTVSGRYTTRRAFLALTKARYKLSILTRVVLRMPITHQHKTLFA